MSLLLLLLGLIISATEAWRLSSPSPVIPAAGTAIPPQQRPSSYFFRKRNGRRLAFGASRGSTAEEGNLMTRPEHEGGPSCLEWEVPSTGFSGPIWEGRKKPHLTTPTNATLPIALMVLDPGEFPTRSMALKSIRKKHIFVRSYEGGSDRIESLGTASTRIFPRDTIRKKRPSLLSRGYQGLTYAPPAVTLPVVYEDNHLAIVNKPARMICHSVSNGGFDKNSVLRAAPHFLTPPPRDVKGVALEIPALVHRLDFLTSGLLVLAKTRHAATDLSTQFANRQVSKYYTALLEGAPASAIAAESTSSQQIARHLRLSRENGEVAPAIEGVGGDESMLDRVIRSDVDGKVAVTRWREIRRIRTTRGVLTLVEFRPRTGRKHQLRRHAAEVLGCPIVGDDLYGARLFGRRKQRRQRCAAAIIAARKRGNAILLCANEIRFRHPAGEEDPSMEEFVHQRIDLPPRFHEFMQREEKRYARYERWMLEEGLSIILELLRIADGLVVAQNERSRKQ